MIASLFLFVIAAATIDPENVISRLERQIAEQQQALPAYHGQRRYFVTHALLRGETSTLVEETSRPPGDKQLRVIERRGAPELERRVFRPLMDAELATARDPQRAATDICRRNYIFQLESYDAGTQAYVFLVKPRTSNPYLFRGKIWVDDHDFAVRKIEGEPAQRLSSWVRSTRFVHEFGKFGNFWLPIRHRSEVDLAIFGRASMGIDYFDYKWEASR